MVPHQANVRIINSAAHRLGIKPEQVMINIERYGNTTGATIPLAPRDAIAEGKLKKGDLVLFTAAAPDLHPVQSSGVGPTSSASAPRSPRFAD